MPDVTPNGVAKLFHGDVDGTAIAAAYEWCGNCTFCTWLLPACSGPSIASLVAATWCEAAAESVRWTDAILAASCSIIKEKKKKKNRKTFTLENRKINNNIV